MLQGIINVFTSFRVYFICGGIIFALITTNIYMLRKYDEQSSILLTLQVKYDTLNKQYDNTVADFVGKLEEERKNTENVMRSLNEVRKIGKDDKCYNTPIGNTIFNKLYK